MGSLFSKQKSPEKAKKRLNGDDEVSDKDRAVLELKNARDRLKKYHKQVSVNIDSQVAIAIYFKSSIPCVWYVPIS